MQETEEKIDKRHIEKRVRDWKKRVADLYATIKLWLKNSEYSLVIGQKSTMFKEQMSRFHVPKTDVDTADIYKNKKFVMTIKPNGLWVIGANGRIDILTMKGNYLLIDFAEEFKNPQWKLYIADKKNGV